MLGRTTFSFGDFELDEYRGELRRGGLRVELPAKPFALLLFLLRHRDRVVSKDELLDALWRDTAISGSALSSAVKQVRRALSDDGASQCFVRTLRGRGFSFVAPVREQPVAERLVAPSVAESTEEHPSSNDVFVGRRRLIRQLARRLESARRSRGGVALLAGEAGIGKTRVLERLADGARARDVPIHRAWCYEGDGAPPLWPWEQVLGGLVEDLEDRTLRAAAAGCGPELAALVPALGDRLPGISPSPDAADAHAQFRLFAGVSRFLRHLARDKEGLLLVFDDLHCADSASLKLLEFLMPDLRGSSLLIIGTFRDPEIDRGHPMSGTLAACARHDGCERILLEGLDRAEIRTLLEQLAGRPIADAWVGAIEQRTDGNPFFIRQLLVSLAGRDLARPEGSELLSNGLAVPRGIRDVIRVRLELLPEPRNAVLELAAVIGPEFDLELLAVASGRGLEELEPQLAQARGCGILGAMENGRGRFLHGLIQETIYADLDESRRTALHARVGEALESLSDAHSGGGLAAMAHHFSQAAGVGSAGKAVDYLVGSARRAVERFAYEEADAHFARALELLGPETPGTAPRRFDMLCERGLVRHRLGAPDMRQTFLEAVAIARELGDGPRLARAAAGFVRREGGVEEILDQEIALLNEALQALGEADEPLQVELTQHLVSRYRVDGSLGRADELIRAAERGAERIGDPILRAEVAQARAWLEWGRTPPEAFLDLADRLVELGDTAGALDPASHGVRLRMATQVVLGDLDAADRGCAELSRRCEEHGLTGWIPTLLGYAACRASARGDFEEARRLSDEQLRVGVGFEEEGALYVHISQQADIKWAKGDLADFEPALRKFSPPRESAVALSLLAVFWARIGKPDEARKLYERALGGASPCCVPRNEFWLATLIMLAEVAAFLGDAARAAELHDLLLPHRNRFATLGLAAMWYGPVASRLSALAGALGRLDEAASHSERAVELCERLEAPAWAARARCDRARILLHGGGRSDRPLALSLLTSVLTTTDRLGMRGLAREAHELVTSA